MALRPEHELHRRRRGRNMGLGLVLGLFVALVFGLSIVKISQGDLMEAFDHQPRASVLPIDPSAPGRTGDRRATLPGAAVPAGSAGAQEGTTP